MLDLIHNNNYHMRTIGKMLIWVLYLKFNKEEQNRVFIYLSDIQVEAYNERNFNCVIFK